jgi:hypothetical protein
MFPKALLVDIDGYAPGTFPLYPFKPCQGRDGRKTEQYKWSSYRDYINVNKSSKWLCIDFVLSLYSIKTSIAKKQYRRFVESMIDVEYESPLKNVLLQRYWVVAVLSTK